MQSIELQGWGCGAGLQEVGAGLVDRIIAMAGGNRGDGTQWRTVVMMQAIWHGGIQGGVVIQSCRRRVVAAVVCRCIGILLDFGCGLGCWQGQ